MRRTKGESHASKRGSQVLSTATKPSAPPAEAKSVTAPPDRIDVERAIAGRFTTLEMWQLDDVTRGDVPPEVLVTYHALQKFGRTQDEVWPGNARLASDLSNARRVVSVRTVQRHIATLNEWGWINRTYALPGQRGRVITCLRTRRPGARGAPPVSPHDTGDAGCRRDYDTGCRRPSKEESPHPDELPPPPSPPVGGGGSSRWSRRDTARWADALAVELVEQFPHAERQGGRLNTSTPKAIARLLRSTARGLEREDVEQLGERIRAAVVLEKQARPALGERRYETALRTWVEDEGWEKPPAFAQRPASAGPTPSQLATYRGCHDQALERIEASIRQGRKPDPLDIERFNLARGWLGLPAKWDDISKRAPSSDPGKLDFRSILQGSRGPVMGGG